MGRKVGLRSEELVTKSNTQVGVQEVIACLEARAAGAFLGGEQVLHRAVTSKPRSS